MLLAASLSMPLFQKAEAFKSLGNSVREPRQQKTSALLSTAWRWKIKPWAASRTRSTIEAGRFLKHSGKKMASTRNDQRW